MADNGIRTSNLPIDDGGTAIEVLVHTDLGNGARGLRRQTLSVFVQAVLAAAGVANVNEPVVLAVLQSRGFTVDGNGKLHLTELEARVVAEEVRAKAAEDALGVRFDVERAERGRADNALGARIDVEASTRGDADIALDRATRALRQVLVDNATDNPVPGFLFNFLIGDAGFFPWGVTSAGTVRNYAADDVNFAPDDEARFSPWSLRIGPGETVQIGLRRDGGVDIPALRITDFIVRQIAATRARQIEGQVGINGDIISRMTVGAARERVLSTASGTTRPYVKRTDIVSSTYLFDTPSNVLDYIPHGGQSLSAGAGSTVVLNPSSACSQNALMLNTGIMAGPVTVDPAAITDFVPAKEAADLARATGETQGSGMINWLRRRDLLRQSPEGVYIYRSHGIGGKLLSELGKGSQSYNNAIAELTRAVAIAQAYGKTLRIRAIPYTHGQGDASAGTSYAAYFAGMKQLRSDYNADMKALLPAGHGDIAMILDQVAADTAGLSPGPVALAQLALCRDEPGFLPSVPGYLFRMAPADQVHNRAIDYVIRGEYVAKTWRRAFLEGETVKGLWPTSVTRAGAQIVITFNVPRGGLVFDTDTIRPARNMGFEYVDESGSASIASVAITAPNQVTVTLSGTPTGANRKVRYAYTAANMGLGTMPGAWGNLRDQDDAESDQIPGTKLFNFCWTFAETVP